MLEQSSYESYDGEEPDEELFNEQSKQIFAVTGGEKNQQNIIAKRRIRTKDESHFATEDAVFDGATKATLRKLQNAQIFDELGGCISSGKEAVIYHAFGETHGDVVLKIYRTSILKFKTRQKYIEGDFRFSSGYSKVIFTTNF